MTREPATPDATHVTALTPCTLRVDLDDGRSGVFDMAPLLRFPAFAALRDPGYFARVGVAHGVVCWPDGEDLAPETVAARLAETNR